MEEINAVNEVPAIDVVDELQDPETVNEKSCEDAEYVSLKEYWGHVWELLKYFVKYFGIAVAETAKRMWAGFLRWAQRNRLLKAIDENGNVIEEEEDDDCDDFQELSFEEMANPEAEAEVFDDEDPFATNDDPDPEDDPADNVDISDVTDD